MLSHGSRPETPLKLKSLGKFGNALNFFLYDSWKVLLTTELVELEIPVFVQ